MTHALLALVLLAQDPGSALSKKVDFTCAATRASVALAQLGVANGIKLETAPQTASEVLVIDVRQVPLKEVLDRVASVCSAAWRDEGGTLRLVAEPGIRQKEDREWTAIRAKSLATSLQRFSASLAETPITDAATAAAALAGGGPGVPEANVPATATGEEVSAPQSLDSAPASPTASPVTRAMYRAVLNLGPTNLAAVRPGERIVFTTRPTRMQKQLPNGSAILGLAIREQALLAEASAKSQPTEGQEDQPSSATFEVFPAAPAKALLSISRSEVENSLSVTFVLYSAEGTVVAESAEGIVLGPDKSGGKREAPLGKDKEVALSPESAEMVRLFGNFSFGASNPSGGQRTTELLTQTLEQPTRFDPLRFVVSDAVTAIAKDAGKNLVANLPDYAIGILSELSDGKIGILEGKRALEREGHTTITEADGWIIARPSFPVESRTNRADRGKLEKLMASVKEQLFPTLDDLAQYALSSPAPSEGDASILYFMLRVPGIMNLFGPGGSDNWTLLRLYGTLSPSQRRVLSSGGRLPMSSFSPQQTAYLSALVYGPEPSLQVDDPNVPPEAVPADGAMEGLWEMFGSERSVVGQGDYRSEPTEALPNGLPADAYLEVGVTESIAVRPDGTNIFTLMMGSLTPGQLAMMTNLMEGTATAEMLGEAPDMNHLRMGRKAAYRFRLNLAEGIRLSAALQEHVFSRAGKIYKLGELPEDFRKAMEEARAKFREQTQGNQESGGEGPPPPRA